MTLSIFAQQTPCLYGHVEALQSHPEQYLQHLRHIQSNPESTWNAMSSAIKARIIAALHICSQHDALTTLLSICEITDIEKALIILDRPRAARQLQQRIEKLQIQTIKTISDNEEDETKDVEMNDKQDTQNGKNDNVDANDADMNDNQSNKSKTSNKKRKRKTPKVEIYKKKLCDIERELKPQQQHHNHRHESCCDSHNNSAIQEMIESASVSGALARKIRKWALSVKSDFLEFVILTMPTKSWHTVADLVHFKTTDFKVPYFLSFVHGEPIPSDTFVAKIQKLLNGTTSTSLEGQTLEEFYFSIAKQYPQIYDSYSFLRTSSFHVMQSPEIVKDLASNIPIDTVIWNFEEMYRVNPECDEILANRLKHVNFMEQAVANTTSKVYTYGKLLERILTFRKMNLVHCKDLLLPLASSRLERLIGLYQHQAKDCKIAVFGDASYSMQTAIEAATAFASMVSASLDAELSFFAEDHVASPYLKPKTVEEALTVIDKIHTLPCTCLAAALYPYYEKREVLDLVVMVTDEEENTTKAGMYFPALFDKYKREVNPNVKLIIVCVGNGAYWFRDPMEKLGLADYQTVTIDNQRPDLTKFDALLGQIAMATVVKK